MPATLTHKKLFETIKTQIEERVRPLIQMDGGDIEILELTPEKVLKIRLHGACIGCGAASMTLEHGVQAILFEEFPDEDIQLLLVGNE